MNILVRRTTIWAFAAFFGCVSLLGPGWHCVFGHHFHGPDACAHAASAESGCGQGCCAPQELASPLPTETASASGETAIGVLADAGHHCPLCQFFGTAQWSQLDAQAELVLEATEFITRAAAARDRDLPRRYLSRAPPRDSEHC